MSEELKLPCIGGCGADIIPAERVEHGYLCPKCFELHEEKCRKSGDAEFWIRLLNHSILKVPADNGWQQSDAYRGDLIEFIKKQAAEIEKWKFEQGKLWASFRVLEAEIAKRDEILKHFGVTEVL